MPRVVLGESYHPEPAQNFPGYVKVIMPDAQGNMASQIGKVEFRLVDGKQTPIFVVEADTVKTYKIISGKFSEVVIDDKGKPLKVAAK